MSSIRRISKGIRVHLYAPITSLFSGQQLLMYPSSETTMLLQPDDRNSESDVDVDGPDAVSVHDTLLVEDTPEEASVSLFYLFALTCGIGG